MSRPIVLILLSLIISCQREKDPTPKPLSNIQMDSIAKSVIGPLLLNLENGKASKVLDSLYSYVMSADHSVQHQWFILKGQQKVIEKEFDSARYFIKQAVALAEENKSEKELMVAKARLAEIDVFQKQWKKALNPALEAYYLARKYDTILPFLNYRLYEVYDAIGDRLSARKYLFEGFHSSKHIPYINTIFSNGIAQYYDNIHETDSAIYFFKALERDTTFYNNHFLAVRDANLGVLLTRKGNAEEGLRYLLKAMPTQKELGIFKPLSMFNIANAYSKLGLFGKSFAYLDSALYNANKSNDHRMIRQIWRLKAENYERRLEYKKALASFDSAYSAFPKEMDSSLTQNARELETQYSLKEKEEKISALEYARQVEAKIAKQQRAIIIALAVMLLLLTTIGFLLWRRRKMQMQLTESNLRFQLLQTKMKPHFFYNLLNGLQGFIREGQIDKSLNYLTMIVHFFRSVLEHSGQEFIPLKEDVAALKNYLNLQMNLFEGVFEYNIEVNDGLKDDDIYVPPMLLQPFVENSILHGFRHIDYAGQINIQIFKRGRVIHCIIEDNGSGLDKKHPQPGKISQSTQITEDRLLIMSKQMGIKGDFKIIDKKMSGLGQGVKVLLDIPYVY